MVQVKMLRRDCRERKIATPVALSVALLVGVSACADTSQQLVTTPPVDDTVIETPPLTDDDLDEEVMADDVVFETVEKCLQGNWEVNNEAFGQYFADNDDRVVTIDVDGLATMTIEDATYRMFFDEWDIRYDTGDPSFLISRNGNETVQFAITEGRVLEVVERDDQVIIELFSIVGGGDGDAVAISTNDPGPLPLDGASLECSGTTLQVSVEGESFVFDRR